MMNKYTGRDRFVIFLAYAHRYLYPIALILASFSAGKGLALPVLGAGLILLALHDVLGYRLRWRHLFCSLQNAHYQPMTPRKINWKQFKSREVYGAAAVCGILGLVMILCHFLFL